MIAVVIREETERAARGRQREGDVAKARKGCAELRVEKVRAARAPEKRAGGCSTTHRSDSPL